MTNHNSIINYMQQKYQLIQDVRTSVAQVSTENYKSPSLLEDFNLSNEPTSLKKKVLKKTKLLFCYLGNQISIYKYKTLFKPEYCNYSTLLVEILQNVLENLDNLENTHNNILTKQKLDRWEVDLLNTKQFYTLTFEPDSTFKSKENKKNFYTKIGLGNKEYQYKDYEVVNEFPNITNFFIKYYLKAGILSKNLTLVANDLPAKNFWEAYVRRDSVDDNADLEYECLYNLIDISKEEYSKEKIDKNIEFEQIFKFLKNHQNEEINKSNISSNPQLYLEILEDLIEGINLESELNEEDLEEYLSYKIKEKEIQKKYFKKN